MHSCSMFPDSTPRRRESKMCRSLRFSLSATVPSRAVNTGIPAMSWNCSCAKASIKSRRFTPPQIQPAWRGSSVACLPALPGVASISQSPWAAKAASSSASLAAAVRPDRVLPDLSIRT